MGSDNNKGLLNNLQDIDKKYISEYDKFFHGWDKENPEKTESQKREIEKHAHIATLRDNK